MRSICMLQIAKLSTGATKRVASGDNRSLVDSFGRIHDYLRVSLTERCNLRCRYCMPAEGIELTAAEKCLNLAELERLTKTFVSLCGVRKIRLTGGEPTIDRKLVPLLNHLNGLREEGLETIALTTNGLSLKKKCRLYKDAGLDRVNISLDTLKERRFEKITRRKGLANVLEGLEATLEAGFKRVKLNCVVMRDINSDELAEFVNLTRRYPIEVRFIEFMPFFGNRWSTNLLVPYREMLFEMMDKFPNIEKIEQEPHETAKIFKEPGAPGKIGFITSMSDNFCSGCNRLRLTSDGNLKVCLFGRAESSLRDLMRSGATDSELVRAIRAALSGKKKQHAGAPVLQSDVSRPMIKIARRAIHGSPQKLSPTEGFTHLDALTGRAKMVNVEHKRPMKRVAVARGEIYVGKAVLDQIYAGTMSKGDVITVAKIAGILSAKMTSKLIVMCHQIALDHVQIDVEPDELGTSLKVVAKVETVHKTGVEMECLTAVAITLLNIYDMCKSAAGDMAIRNIELVFKRKTDLL